MWSRIVTTSGGGVDVNMAFDRDAPEGRVVSLTPRQGKLSIIAKGPAETVRRYRLRVPAWADRRQIAAYRDGRAEPVVWGGPDGAYLIFDRVTAGRELTVTYPLIEFDQTVTVGDRSGPQTVRIRWRGNTVVAMEPRAERFPLFP